MENQTTPTIEVKKAWHINWEAEVVETTGFQIQVEGTYGVVPETYYMGTKGWKKGCYSESVVFTEAEAQVAKKKRMEERLKSLEQDKRRNEEQIAKYIAELNAQ